MKSLNIFFILFLLFYFNADACINGEILLLQDKFILYEDREGDIPYGHDFYLEDAKEMLHQLDSIYRNEDNLGAYSDMGIIYLLTGKHDEAVQLYQEIERIEPGRYATASNLGTVYELMGENEKALQWIQKAVEIDPSSHNHSEWIHVNILKAKIKGASAVNSQSLIGTHFGTESYPVSNMDEIQLQKLANALYFQLNERISFIKPKNDIVAQLLFDLGDVHALLNHNYTAKSIYEMALDYGYDAKKIGDRLHHVKSSKDSPFNLLNLAIFIACLIPIIIFSCIMLIRRKSS